MVETAVQCGAYGAACSVVPRTAHYACSPDKAPSVSTKETRMALGDIEDIALRRSFMDGSAQGVAGGERKRAGRKWLYIRRLAFDIERAQYAKRSVFA